MTTPDMKILVIDDVADNVELIVQILEDGYEMLKAYGGAEGLALAKAQHPDLILLDSQMPGMDGHEVLRQLQADEAMQGIPVIIITAHHKDVDRVVAALKLGALDYLTKPIADEILVAKVDLLMRLRHAEQVRQAENQERHRLASALECAADSIAVLDHDGTIQYVNLAYERHCGWRKEDMLGKRLQEIGHAKNGEQVYHDMWQTVRSGVPWNGQLVTEMPNGKIVDEEITVSPVLDNLGIITNFITVKRDVTEQRKLEWQLRQAQKLDSIGQLAAGIAHEINTPTQFVSDNLRFLQDSFDSIQTVLATYESLLQVVEAGNVDPRVVDGLKHALAEADLEFMSEEIPKAVKQIPRRSQSGGQNRPRHERLFASRNGGETAH